jgi:hypothetical protein
MGDASEVPPSCCFLIFAAALVPPSVKKIKTPVLLSATEETSGVHRLGLMLYTVSADKLFW